MQIFMKKNQVFGRLLLCVMIQSLLIAFSSSIYAASDQMDWQPAASETLIRMPAKYIDASIESNFQQSSLASGIHALEAQIQLEVTRMHEAYESVSEMENTGNSPQVDEQNIEIRHQFLTAKSNYLGLLNEKQQLSERVLQKKAALYQRVLKKIRNEKTQRADPVSMALIEKQKSARARLNQSVGQVDELLSQRLSSQFLSPESAQGNDYKASKYQREYSENLAKVQTLKNAIQKHSANENPLLDGQSLNREQYMRYLLGNVDSELALLDQERVMLGYMAKLVALDAQALEHEITSVEPDGKALSIKQQIRIANTTELFIN